MDSYEVAARALTAAVAILNHRDRGNSDLFQTHPDLGSKFSPRSLADFHKQNNAPKLAYLRGDPLFGPFILPALDPKLRNAIGHYSASFDQVAGTISYISDKRSGTREVVSEPVNENETIGMRV